MLVPVRRIVTHNDAEGRSYALKDEIATNIIGTLTELWTTGPAPHDHKTIDDAGAKSKTLEPVANGTVFRYFQIPPQSSTEHLSREERLQAWSDLFRNIGASHCQPDTSRDPGMHMTSTTDYIILLSGQITLVLDKTEHDLKPFDVVIQRGTNHAWVNRGTEEALLMAVLVDAKGV
ncbi:cupin domain-containing protein [Paraburkholderia kururiensis]|uniref:cupin domain-containing protein n=1 Tax=Paraburkholderia kururiensis TaxID=984307 RepID=UPI000367E33F|nr:cupin domain-containing protein [Paraburkholderia kururiensis]